MTVYRPDEFTILDDQGTRLRRLEAGCPPFVEPDDTDLLNGWTNAGLPYEVWGYRICDGALEFKGHLSPGSSGSTVYTLPDSYLIFPGDLSFLTDIVNGATFSVARVFISMTAGDLTITYPAI